MMKKSILSVLAFAACSVVFAQGFTPVKLNNSDFTKLDKQGKVAFWAAFNRDWPGNVKTVKDADGKMVLNVQPTKSPTQKTNMAMLFCQTPIAIQNGDQVRVSFLFRLKKMDKEALGTSVVMVSSNGGKFNAWMSTLRSFMKLPVPNVWKKYDRTITVAKQPKAGTFTMTIQVKGKEVEFRDFAVEVKKAAKK